MYSGTRLATLNTPGEALLVSAQNEGLSEGVLFGIELTYATHMQACKLATKILVGMCIGKLVQRFAIQLALQ